MSENFQQFVRPSILLTSKTKIPSRVSASQIFLIEFSIG